MFWPPKPKLFEAADIAARFAGRVGDVIQVALGVGRLVVDRRRQHVVADRQQADDQLGGAGRGDQMPHHALGARDRDLVGLVAEDALDRQRLDLVVDFGARAVGVDVVDVVEVQLRRRPGAIRRHLAAPRPSGCVSVMRKASAVEP